MKIKNLIIYFSVVVIVFLSLKAPNFLMNKLSKNIEKKFYKIEENKNQIDVEAEKIYLVKAIHNIRSDNPTVSINSNNGKVIAQTEEMYEIVSEAENSFPNINKELKDIENYNILANLNLDGFKEYGIGIISKTYLNKNKYIVHNVLVSLDNVEIHLEVEDKTKKIIYLYFDKDLFSSQNIKETLENFVRYLDLNIINDWKYSEDLISEKYYLKSEKADLAIVLDKSNDEKYELSVRLNNWYNIDTNFIQAWYNLMISFK